MKDQDIAKRIRHLRQKAGLTLTEVAAKANITKGTLSKIETNRISPPISTLSRIAEAISVRLADFFVEEGSPPAYVITRSGEGDEVMRDGSRFGYSYKALVSEKPDKAADFFLLTIQPDDPEGEFHHGGQEFIHMLSGGLELTIRGDVLVLRAGDSICFDASNVHRTKVLGKRPAKFLCVFM